jgi:hypothetical protein
VDGGPLGKTGPRKLGQPLTTNPPNPRSRPTKHRHRNGGPLGKTGPRKLGQPLTTNPPNPRSQPTTPNTSHRRAVGAGFTSRWLGAGLCRLAGRSLRASCPSLARGKPRYAILAALGFPTPLDWHGPAPREPGFRARRHIEAPRREPVGRRAVGQNRSPEVRTTAPHQPAQNAITTNQTPASQRRAVGQNRSPEARTTAPHQPAQNAITTNQTPASQRRDNALPPRPTASSPPARLMPSRPRCRRRPARPGPAPSPPARRSRRDRSRSGVPARPCRPSRRPET